MRVKKHASPSCVVVVVLCGGLVSNVMLVVAICVKSPTFKLLFVFVQPLPGCHCVQIGKGIADLHLKTCV